MVNIDDIWQAGTLGGHTVMIQSDPKWFKPGNINQVVEFEMDLINVCAKSEITLSRFIPYAPYLLRPEPDSSYFAEVFDKLEVSSVVCSSFASWRLNGTADQFTQYAKQIDVELNPDRDLVFAAPESDSLVSALRKNSTPMNCVGFSRMNSFFFDPYFKVEFDE